MLIVLKHKSLTLFKQMPPNLDNWNIFSICLMFTVTLVGELIPAKNIFILQSQFKKKILRTQPLKVSSNNTLLHSCAQSSFM